MKIQTLIDKKDSFEVIRDQIAGILVTETANQQELAVIAGSDPELYKFDVYMERSSPWEKFLNPECEDFTPIVNVWYDGSTFDPAASNTFERQKTEAIFNIEVYGLGQSTATDNGHASGDELASLEAQRMLRLVRNILMASININLQLKGLVWNRWPQSVKMFQPHAGERPVNHVVAGRLALSVTFNEFSPQYVHENLEYVAIQVLQSETGQVLLAAEYDYT